MYMFYSHLQSPCTIILATPLRLMISVVTSDSCHTHTCSPLPHSIDFTTYAHPTTIHVCLIPYPLPLASSLLTCLFGRGGVRAFQFHPGSDINQCRSGSLLTPSSSFSLSDSSCRPYTSPLHLTLSLTFGSRTLSH